MRHYEINQSKFLNQTELQEIKFFIQNGNSRDSLLIDVALSTGARAQEILNLQAGDLNHTDKTIHIRGLKGSKDRQIPLRDELYTKIINHIQGKSRESNIFDIGYQRLDQIWNKYRPNGKKFHSLRHSFAIELFRRTKDLKLVQTALGHRSIINTMVYADYIYSTEEMRRIL